MTGCSRRGVFTKWFSGKNKKLEALTASSSHGVPVGLWTWTGHVDACRSPRGAASPGQLRTVTPSRASPGVTRNFPERRPWVPELWSGKLPVVTGH